MKKIFDFTLGDYEREVKKSALRLGYTSLGACPHVLRHSGASIDEAHSRWTLKEVQKREGWASSASVAHYKKGALILQLMRKVPMVKQRKAASAANACRRSSFSRCGMQWPPVHDTGMGERGAVHDDSPMMIDILS
eukprot:6126407-Pyramimonas_sp.AAC.1